ncbi:MAG: hypothetical protein AB7S50_07880 [Bacteroidales bacterium]
MSKINKFKPRTQASYERHSRKLNNIYSQPERFVVFSLKEFDRTQGQSFKDWEKKELLSLLLDKLSSINQLTISQAIQQQIIKVYTKVAFPPNTVFHHPRHIPDGVKWASIHIQGRECIIGYIEDNIFYIVFLDENHEFWKTNKKHT